MILTSFGYILEFSMTWLSLDDKENVFKILGRHCSILRYFVQTSPGYIASFKDHDSLGWRGF